MHSGLWLQICRIVTLALAIVIGGAGSSLAQQPQAQPFTIVVKPGQSEDDIKQLLDIAAKSGKPVVVQVQDAGSNPPAAAAPAVMETTPEMAVTNMSAASWETLSAAIWRGATIAWSGLFGMSIMMGMTSAGLAAEGSDYGKAGFAVLLALAAACAGVFVIRFVLGHLVHHHRERVLSVAGTFRQALARLIGDLASIALFVGLSRMVLNSILAPHMVSHQIARGVVTAVVVSLIYTAAGRFLFKPVRNGAALIAIRRPHWHLRMIVAYGVIGAFFSETVRLGAALGMDIATADGWFLIGNTVLTVQKLVWFIGGRSGIRDAFIGERPGLVRRVIGNILPDFYVVSAIVIWLAGFLVAGTPDSARWSIAANSTQVILLAVPILALGAHALINELVRYSEQNYAPGLWTAVLASLRVVVSGAAWIGGLHLITAIWQPLMGGNVGLATGWFIWLERLSLAIVASWAVCTLIWKYFDSIAPSPQISLPGHDDDQEKKPTSRLVTALPVVRNLALGTVLAVGGLLVLSSIGINVAPLLAGFGVLGLALSFGSQALVKDVVSGIFFIADDAFRIGEYIDTGRLKGTVEQITVRSIRLRHHNGPVHTIPFGQISSVTNFSRDWGTIKFEFRFEREADTELIRKVAKRVGLAMLEDPDYGSEFLIPLKMQGIQDITESSMIVRFKFTSRPGNPSIIKREAMKKLIAAFREAGLEFASNAVTVRSHSGASPEAGAAASAALLQAPPPAAVAS